ncbi:BZ3500_MvSof-1268-A1-R1_Chr7-1g09052 [Microbotryum saponariae]|uniref:BZ3500_MvSof-1268-A1-R1_Chr7-1g09052 protein n=1 Tax=Microbotryum saponariae TaxID=289078 RepID=A0A2X0N0W4_9BASI|nr:BZ3501_MvSof-1269-A2-R1_Chr7-1g08756 [Microbotryum saponariae]SDA02697.1 BZ3500_MvSof-1268-A1-R1_Chr7-1g09052 [Microbotryum saponariae]
MKSVRNFWGGTGAGGWRTELAQSGAPHAAIPLSSCCNVPYPTVQLLSRFFRKRSADNTDDKIVGTSATTASTACQNEIGPCVDTLHSANTASQVQAAKRRFDELSIHNDGQNTGSIAIDQSTKKPSPQSRPRKTEEEKEEAAIAKSERAAQQAAERELDDERARQLKEAERARLEAERAPQRQLILDEQSQRMQFPPAKVYTTQSTLNFAPATTSPQTPFPDGSSAIPSASDASVSTNSTSRSIPTSVGSALPDNSDSFNSLEGGIHRNLRQRFPKSGVSPCHANACLADYVLVHNLTVSPTPPSRFEEAATILTHYPLCSQVGTFNRTGKPFVGHYDLWPTVELHRLRRKTSAFLPRHSTTVSDIVNPLLYTTETFGIVPVVQSPTAQMRFLIEPYHVERGTQRLEPVKWSPWSLLQNNTPSIQHMQSRLPTDRKLRHDWLAERQGTRFAVLHVHTPSERALYRYLSSKVRLGTPQSSDTRDYRALDTRDYRALEQMPEHINTWASRWSSLANVQATMNMGGNDVRVIQALLTDPSRGRDVSVLAAEPLLGHKPPVLGRLTEVEVDASDPPTSSIRPFVATASSDAGSSAGLGTSSALTRAGTTKGARHCRLCGQTTCRRKGSKLSDDGSMTGCDGACLDCGKPFGLTDEMDSNDAQSRRFCRGLTRAEMNGRARHQKAQLCSCITPG